MKFLLDIATSITSITGVLITIVIMICFYIYMNRRIHKIENKIDNVLNKTLQTVQEVVNESNHVQCYSQSQEPTREYRDDDGNNNEYYDANNIEEEDNGSEEEEEDTESGDDEHYEDDEEDIDENELIDADGMNLRETSLDLDESNQNITDDVIPIFDTKYIHTEDKGNELKKKSVSDLRKQIVDMNLKTYEEAKKMKKVDIIKLLEDL